MSHTLIPALNDINVPPHVSIRQTDNMESLMSALGRRSLMGRNGDVFFGTAFVQGERLQFCTAMPISRMLDCTHSDRSQKRDNLKDTRAHSNRPKEVAHAKHLRTYLEDTACEGEKFILPSFTFNYGVGLDETSQEVTLWMLADETEGANTWPAILFLPAGARLDTTDGAHRRGEIEGLANDTKHPEKRQALFQNAVDVKIVFECERQDAHQDFADCGKAKAIPKGMVVTFDVRDHRNRRCGDLVASVPFLAANVDSTASNVNLSAKSSKIWSMSAVRMFVGHIINHATLSDEDTMAVVEKARQKAIAAGSKSQPTDPVVRGTDSKLDLSNLSHEQQEALDNKKVEGAEEFFTSVIKYQPELRLLSGPAEGITVATLREMRGGSIALRGVGMAIFARAFLLCKEEGIAFEDVAKKLGDIDWYILRGNKATLDAVEGDTTVYRDRVHAQANPLWVPLLVIGESRYRVSSSSLDTDAVWMMIRPQILDAKQPQAA